MKKTRIKKLILPLVSTVLLMSGCYYDNEEELYPGPGGDGACDTVTVSFTAQIEPLINTKCAVAGCHLNNQSPLLTSYSAISANASRIRQRVYVSKDMPPPGSGYTLSDNERELINNWICQGALNN